jgi:hypothetical protein
MKQIQRNPLAKLLFPLVNKNRIGKLPLYLNLFDNMVVYAMKIPPSQQQRYQKQQKPENK